MNTNEPVDLVYTWVDDGFPGYRALLEHHSDSAHDRNPNRTRDNLDMLRYSLRSVHHYLPWIRKIHILSCRPQVPEWLVTNHPRISIVHHDRIMDRAILPTFNSFAIISHLHLIPGLTRRFLYFEDDMLVARPFAPEDLMAPDGLIRFYPRFFSTPGARHRHRKKLSPWNLALAHTNHLLDGAYGLARRKSVNHVPLFIDAPAWGAMIDRWAEPFESTRHSRFRAMGNVAPEHLYPYYMVNEGLGQWHTRRETYRRSVYLGLENQRWLNAMTLGLHGLRCPMFITMNDNFGRQPNPRAVAHVRAYLARRFPWPSPFERIEPVYPDEYDLHGLLAGITPENLHTEVNFGPAVGREEP
ncbi:MAG: Stealth protein CR3, conserved region 3 [Candidatus Kentron sp. G]|nr:MAG: Stealth protein CR3, conserved region 3 [Candidatus Kentron sp. G]VFN01337.1 MAG: Stealth protein CR3, conserved region 3 [Candidatus Kentron sp. G]VFN05070.1 MAG: Stealth protein CR3, conserved region 3 [Candidatus Kentron sp. G]